MNFKIHVLVCVILLLCKLCAADDCNILCGRDYNPVCGKSDRNMKTFSNVCMMNYYNCQKGTDFAVFQKNECPDGQS